MKNYFVFKNKKSGRLYLVKQGFNWPAFFFTWIWGLCKGAYFYSILFLLFTIIFIIPVDFVVPGVAIPIALLLHAIIGFNAEKLLVHIYKKSKYVRLDDVQAKNMGLAMGGVV